MFLSIIISYKMNLSTIVCQFLNKMYITNNNKWYDMAIERKKDTVYEHLRQEILERRLCPGSRLPREVELAKQLGVGQVTLRSALARLEAEKLVERMPGKGTYITDLLERHTFMMVLPDGAESIETSSRYVAAGIDEAANDRAVTLERCPIRLLMSFSDSECREMIQRHQISGVILESGHNRIAPDLIARMKMLNLPVVVPHGLPNDAEETGFSILRTDERKAFAGAFHYLQKLGHRRIAILLLNLPAENLTAIRGFTHDELKEFYQYNNLSTDLNLIRYVSNQTEESIRTVRAWMLGPNPPTAIICHSDQVAMRVYQALKEMNIRIPQQISVMGYNNYPGSQLLLPPLTTIDIQFKKCGEMALDQLMNHEEWFQPGITPPEIFTPHKLIERGSTVQSSL